VPPISILSTWCPGAGFSLQGTPECISRQFRDPSATFFSARSEALPVVSMDGKKVFIAMIAGGVLLLIAELVFSQIGILVAPYDVFAIGGMRPRDDPLNALFFAYPFVLALTSAIVFDRVKGSLGGWDPGCCSGTGLTFGLILFLLVTVPSMFVIYSSMTYPPGFYIGNILMGILGFPALGMLYARIWGA
jgi:hypothetical protein